MINNVFIDDYLVENHLSMIDLNVLIPNEQMYTALFIQPREEINASQHFIGHRNQESAYLKFSKFIQLALATHAELVISPEYSCPWQVIEESIANGYIPENGALWILGCESITPDELSKLKQKYNNVFWMYEDLVLTAEKYFLDPVCYILRATNQNNISECVIIVQFKNQSMVDHNEYLENRYMLSGKKRYILRNNADSIYLTTVICADALVFNVQSLPPSIHQPYLIVHPQLNKNPRHSQIIKFRHDTYDMDFSHRAFICVNWAKGFQLSTTSSEFGGSAYYTKAKQLRVKDDEVNQIHHMGMYYTYWVPGKSHAYFFNYDEKVFLFSTCKPSQASVPEILHTRRGPTMLAVYSWENPNKSWINTNLIDDGFDDICKEIGDLMPLQGHDLTPIDKERLLALSTGYMTMHKNGRHWYDIDQLKSFQLVDCEINRRMTVTNDPSSDVFDERWKRLCMFNGLKNRILPNIDLYPKCIKDLSGNCKIIYPIGPNGYNYNLKQIYGEGKATGVFLGLCMPTEPNRVFNNLAAILEDDQRRLVIWYEDTAGKIQCKWKEKLPLITDNLTENESHYDREEVSKA